MQETVHLLIDLLKIEIYEWETPAPTLWKEYVHHVNSGTSYISKLDEFEAFVRAIQKFPVYIGSSKRAGRYENATVILIDDLPVPSGREACQKLCRCLQTLALSAQFPTILLVTEFTEDGDREGPSRMILELELALERGGATKIAFNPLTAKAITKTLAKIWKAEYLSPPPDWLSNISESSGGDIRHAINSLQYICLSKASGTWDPGGSECLALPNSKSRKQSQKKVVQSSTSLNSLKFTDKVKSRMGRDGILSLFHALGKVLHNKRETDEIADSGQSSVVIKENFVRYPLKMDMPEVVLSQAHAEAGTFSAFLHENVLDFINEEAIDDAWMALSYLSDSDCLLGARSSHYRRTQALLEWDEVDSAFIVESISGSVMTRGVLFGNSHPAPPRWQSIRGPTLWQVERCSHKKKMEIFSERLASGGYLKTCSLSVVATEFKPFLQILGQLSFRMQRESLRDYNEECDNQQWDCEEVEAPEIDSIELDDLFSDGNILSTLDINDDYTCVNSRSSEIVEEMDIDEIEEWSTPPSSSPETSSYTYSSSPTSSSSINNHQTYSKSSTPSEPISSNKPLGINQKLIPIDLFQNEETIRAFTVAYEDIALVDYKKGFSLDFDVSAYCEEKVDSFNQEMKEEPQIMQLDPPLILPSSHSSICDKTPWSCIDPWPIFSSPNNSSSIIIPQSKSLVGSTPSSPLSSFSCRSPSSSPPSFICGTFLSSPLFLIIGARSTSPLSSMYGSPPSSPSSSILGPHPGSPSSYIYGSRPSSPSSSILGPHPSSPSYSILGPHPSSLSPSIHGSPPGSPSSSILRPYPFHLSHISSINGCGKPTTISIVLIINRKCSHSSPSQGHKIQVLAYKKPKQVHYQAQVKTSKSSKSPNNWNNLKVVNQARFKNAHKHNHQVWCKVHKPLDRELKLPYTKSMFQDKSQSFVECELTTIIEIGENMTLDKQTRLVSLIKEVANIVVGSYHTE
ncbi:hypothetical protein KI387_035973 [Taxus chinensis]|uniref:Uncharacterized protein n=1 Tax=Taxus chinensis TaxID=29808 RepID=A0AA38L1B7_TAXCH|nr:hypothetical protein KI387_035973 [Taxus chinensis]